MTLAALGHWYELTLNFNQTIQHLTYKRSAAFAFSFGRCTVEALK
jgi:hypothetical protein